MPDLETVDLTGVEILEAGVTIHGVGSPPEGDTWTGDDLRAMATAAQELEATGEWRIPTKIGAEPLGRSKLGHGKEQTLLDSGELPAAGWLANQRVSADGTKLLADVKDVPRKVADLIKAKAYRTRSSELGSVKSQKTGKTYPWVVSGLAFLGGKMPAVRTLDDVVALYQGDDIERRFLQSDEIDAPSTDDLRDVLAGFGTQLAREFQADRSREQGRADIRPVSTKTYTDEQRKKYSEALAEHKVEVKPEDVTDEMLANAGVAVETPQPPTPDGPQPPPTEPAAPNAEKQLEQIRKFEERANAADERVRKLEEKLRNKDRDVFVEEVLRDGKATPGQRDDIVAMYEESPEVARKFFANAPVNDQWSREYGSDDEEITDEQREADEKSYEEYAKTTFGVEKVL